MVVGAVVGGVLGAVLAKKARHTNPKRLVPAKVPQVGKRALSVVKSVASDAMVVAKAAGRKAADEALEQVKTAAQQFVIDVAAGEKATPPPPAPPPPAKPVATRSTPRKSAATPKASTAKPASRASKPKPRRPSAK
jgi:hypothetical protein